ncbi:MAG: flagellar basal body rod protein FlgC [Vicinamibacterales bacterium]|nr:flagellar basal body rod protein FlgC [Vicinamibacterales bacterium]
MSTLSAAVSAAASALNAERTRIEAAVSNIANAESTRGPDGTTYRRRDVVLGADSGTSFESALGRATATGVKVVAVLEDQEAPRMRFEPQHPDADEEGYVAMPNVDPAQETVDMLSAARAYQANLTAIGLLRDLLQRSLELGRG